MRETERYYWIKLPIDFFRQKEVNFLMNMSDGHALVVTYLKMLLLGANEKGVYSYLGYLESIEEELACQLSEPVESVRRVVSLLDKCNYLRRLDDGSLILDELANMVGSETGAAMRMRKLRSSNHSGSIIATGQVTQNVQCANNVTHSSEQSANKVTSEGKQCDIEKEIEKELDCGG